MHTELDRFTKVLQFFGYNRSAVKYALRMRKKCMNKGDMESATEWYLFALAILRRLRKPGGGSSGKVTIH